eukprot:gb/GFBE01036748.1/.p1 GENE.gb/GFBE01036748.1/~~gb/GFBE01036748.1/.p1  ORF type:complete len:237 (+),score=55.39 gb/GFBE01036748.1/:1-711(+)
MVIPLGAGPAQEGSVPDVVKDVHCKYWWCLAAMFLSLAVTEIVAADVFAVLFHTIMAGIVYYMVKDQCKNMSMYCLLIVGMLCTFQAFIELIALISSVGGRRTQKTVVKQGSDNVTTYTTEVTTHPFFDESQGVQYNVQSALMIASPLVMIFAVACAYYSYNAHSSSLFEEPEDSESGPMYGRGMYGGGGGMYGGGYGGAANGGAGRSAGQPLGRSSAPPPAQPVLFQGAGQRLGG